MERKVKVIVEGEPNTGKTLIALLIERFLQERNVTVKVESTIDTSEGLKGSRTNFEKKLYWREASLDEFKIDILIREEP